MTTATSSQMKLDDSKDASVFVVYDGDLAVSVYDTEPEAEAALHTTRLACLIGEKFKMTMKELQEELNKINTELISKKLLPTTTAATEEKKDSIAPVFIHFVRDANTKVVYGTFNNYKLAQNLHEKGKIVIWLTLKNYSPDQFQREMDGLTRFRMEKKQLMDVTEDEKKHIVAG